MKSNLFLIVILLLFASCKKEKPVANLDKQTGMSLMIIHFYSDVNISSMITCDFNTGYLIFQQLGDRNSIFSGTPEKSPNLPTNINFKMNYSEIQFVKDSIISKFSSADFVNHTLRSNFNEYNDHSVLVEDKDAYFTRILITTKDGFMRDFSLNNASSKNQSLLIRYLLSVTMDRENDEWSKDYLKQLMKYYE